MVNGGGFRGRSGNGTSAKEASPAAWQFDWRSGYNTHAGSSGLYAQPYQNKLADEVEAAALDAAFPLALQYYALLRAQVRAGCRN